MHTGVPTDERRALLELVDGLAQRWPAPAEDAARSLARGRRDLAGSGLWALGLSESSGGGGADHETVQAVIARVAGHRPALGLAMAHLHAASDVLAGHPGLLADVAAGRSAVGVTEGRYVDGLRVDFWAEAGPLVLLTDDGCRLAPASAVTRGAQIRRTGMDGLYSGPVDIDVGALERCDSDPDQVRDRLRAGLLAVAAGVADAVHRHALGYTAQRVQFGAPLDALPTMRERLDALHGHAAGLRGLAVRPTIEEHGAQQLLLDGVDRAVTACRLAVQSLGGYGYLEEYPVARLFRDAVSLRAAAAAIGTC